MRRPPITFTRPKAWGSVVVAPPAPKPRPNPGDNRAKKLAIQWGWLPKESK